MTQPFPLHIVDPSSRGREDLARMASQLGYCAKSYADIDALKNGVPLDGILVMRDDPGFGGATGILAWLEAAGGWLPLILIDRNPATRKIVTAMQAGAMDYLRLPLDRCRFADALERVSRAADGYRRSQRSMIEARNRMINLSGREREVLDWLAEGSSNKGIARMLGISPRTVEIHRANMMSKLGAKHSTEAVRVRIEAGYEGGVAL